MKSQYPKDTVATTDWPSGNGRCAEFGQKSQNGNKIYTNAQFVDQVSYNSIGSESTPLPRTIETLWYQ